MGQKKNRYLKVAWICHFSNEIVRARMGVDQGIDFAPWITLSIKEVEKRNDIELHVIAPHRGIRNNIHYQENGIHYHFIKTGIPFLRRNWPRFFKWDQWTGYQLYSKKIEKIVKTINPDIINLQGAENPHYSASILRLKDFHVMVNVQGIFSLIKEGNLVTKYEKYRALLEQKIYREFHHFGIRADFMKSYIAELNPDAHFYHQVYPIKSKFVTQHNPEAKEYDLIYFARIVKEKGIEDVLEALRIIKNKQPEIKLCIIGGGDKNYINFIKNLIENKDLLDNVVFKGLMKTQDEVHLEASKAKISLLPTHNDTIPGTIVESMFLGLPVVSYPVGGIPTINENEIIITLAEYRNIQNLADKTYELLQNQDKRKHISEKGKKVAREMFNNTKNISNLIGYYHQILKNADK